MPGSDASGRSDRSRNSPQAEDVHAGFACGLGPAQLLIRVATAAISMSGLSYERGVGWSEPMARHPCPQFSVDALRHLQPGVRNTEAKTRSRSVWAQWFFCSQYPCSRINPFSGPGNNGASRQAGDSRLLRRLNSAAGAFDFVYPRTSEGPMGPIVFSRFHPCLSELTIGKRNAFSTGE